LWGLSRLAYVRDIACMPLTPVITATVSERVERDSVQVVECTIPAEMTLDEWRRNRPRARNTHLRPRRQRTPRANRHLTLVPDLPLLPSSDPEPLAA
jgi:hypothetical protein